MAVKIMRGDSYLIPVEVTQNGQAITPNIVTDIEVSIGTELQKRLSYGEVVFLDGTWYFRLSQEETFALEDSNTVYVRVVYPGSPNNVIGVRAGMIIALETGSSEVL